MKKQLSLVIGQQSSAGRKTINQDFHGVWIPKEPALSTKGIAVALADGISSSQVSHIASETAVSNFLDDYYCTSDAWSVKTSGQRVLSAVNSWLYAQSQSGPDRFNKDKGYVCTFSALVFKSNTAHLFHIGDARIYRLSGNSLEQLTQDHRHRLSADTSYLSRALGIQANLEIDYREIPVELDDIFLLATDGVYEHVSAASLAKYIQNAGEHLQSAADDILEAAFDAGSNDNLTVQIVKVKQLPEPQLGEVYQQVHSLSPPSALRARMPFDGYDVIRELHISSRSHIYLVRDQAARQDYVLKCPSNELRHDERYLEKFMLEEWILRRINNAHVLKAPTQTRQRHYLYILTEYIEGQTLSQWMLDNPRPELEQVRDIIAQVAKGLQAMHRQEILHQDLRPQNIMIDRSGTVKIIDLGACRVAGLAELAGPVNTQQIVGTVQYTAPEYFCGELATPRSDIFALGVIAYHMLSGVLPYGNDIAKTRTRREQQRLKYTSLVTTRPDIPMWVDEAIKKAVRIDSTKRYIEVSEFVFEIQNPNPAYLGKRKVPLMDKNPVLFWQAVSLLLAACCIYLVLERA